MIGSRATLSSATGHGHVHFAKFKGQLISKANCETVNSSKKQTNEFVFTSMRRVFVRFLEESSARKKRFEII